MSILPPLLAILAVAPVRAALPPIYLYHDDKYAHFGYLNAPKYLDFTPGAAWPLGTVPGDPCRAHRAMMVTLGSALGQGGVAARLLDAPGWLELCRGGSHAIVVNICQTTPDLIFAGQSQGSPLERWLAAGGILVQSGDWPFFWYCDGTGKVRGDGAMAKGDEDIFHADLVKDGFTDLPVAPTELARQYLPSVAPVVSQRPFDLAAVKAACPWFEVYLQGERAGQVAADGLAFRVPGGQGYFVGFHFLRGPHTDTAQAVLEFLGGRAPRLFGGEGT